MASYRDGFEIGVDRLVEEAPLRVVQMFTARRNFQRFLVRAARDPWWRVFRCFDQSGGELAQLLGRSAIRVESRVEV